MAHVPSHRPHPRQRRADQPRPDRPRPRFDVADLYRGPAAPDDNAPAAEPQLDEKLRQAYFWIVNHAIISPYYDIEYNDGPHQTFTFGDSAEHGRRCRRGRAIPASCCCRC